MVSMVDNGVDFEGDSGVSFGTWGGYDQGVGCEIDMGHRRNNRSIGCEIDYAWTAVLLPEFRPGFRIAYHGDASRGVTEFRLKNCLKCDPLQLACHELRAFEIGSSA